MQSYSYRSSPNQFKPIKPKKKRGMPMDVLADFSCNCRENCARMELMNDKN
jgi:hypothetical protein